jgi:glycosyltransferase involved in cell wall biosynthesis
MDGKIRILFYNLDSAGVNYFRTLTPAMELERNHSDEFYVEINPQIDFNDPKYIDYLKTFHIIHYHRQFLGDTKQMLSLATELRKSGTILMVDIDDYWVLHKKHPFYSLNLEKKMHIPIMENLKIADYVTTTTDLFADEISKVTGRDNVSVFYNSIDPTWMKQFQNNWKPDPDGLVRITYMAGSCYDDQTEILTENGFKLFKDLNMDEKVATLNSSGELEYQLPTDYTNEEYFGDMFYGKNKNIDFAVTPNHNMFVHKSKSQNRRKPFNFNLNKMENLNGYDLTFKKNCKWNGKEKDFFTLEKCNSVFKEFNDINFEMDDWLKFFGYWIGDGWTTCDGSNQVGICGVKESSIITMKEIETILIKYGFNPTWTKDGIQLRIFNQQLFKYLNQFGGANDKFIPNEIKNLSSRQLQIFIDYYLKADGTIRKNGRLSCDTISKNLVNDFSEIALKLGTCVTVKNRGIRTSIMKDGRIITGKHDGYCLNFYGKGVKSQLTPTVNVKDIVKKEYRGNIYCVTVPNHILYIRRNGFSYWCGNSHMVDVEQLESVVNWLDSNQDTHGKFKIIIAGWDTEGNTTDITFNQNFGTELQKRGLWTNQMVKAINKSRGNVDVLPNLPADLKEKYRGKIFDSKQRDIKSIESIYLHYEKILTDNHHIITNPDYVQWLLNFERNVSYPNEGNFARRWTQKANTYAQVLDETDIEIAPLADNPFNYMKSNLKQVECWSRKLPIVCSDVPPYNIDGRHMENCVLIPNEKNAHKYWKKYLKKLILDADLRKQLGEQLYEDFSDKYNLATVTKKRADFYKAAVAKTLAVI